MTIQRGRGRHRRADLRATGRARAGGRRRSRRGRATRAVLTGAVFDFEARAPAGRLRQAGGPPAGSASRRPSESTSPAPSVRRRSPARSRGAR